MRHRWLRPLAGGLVVVACITGACSGSSKKHSPTPAPPATATAAPTALQTAVAAGGQVALYPYKDPNKRFTASLPQGWTVEEPANITLLSLGVKATLGIQCAPGLSVPDFEAQDQRGVAAVHSGTIDFSRAQPTVVAGQAAQIVPWSGGLGGGSQVLQHISVYFAGNGCAWRVQLTTLPGTDIQSLRPLLDKVLASFAFT